jgi:hypothetical protein
MHMPHEELLPTETPEHDANYADKSFMSDAETELFAHALLRFGCAPDGTLNFVCCLHPSLSLSHGHLSASPYRLTRARRCVELLPQYPEEKLMVRLIVLLCVFVTRLTYSTATKTLLVEIQKQHSTKERCSQ